MHLCAATELLFIFHMELLERHAVVSSYFSPQPRVCVDVSRGAYVYCTSHSVGKTPTWGGNFGKEQRQCVTAPESDGERGTSCGCVSGVGFTNHPHYNTFCAGSSVKRSRPAISGHNGCYTLPEKYIPMIQIVPQKISNASQILAYRTPPSPQTGRCISSVVL